jgi:hypothetical protein
VQEIANQHGCIITIEESRPGKPVPGSLFCVKFLLAR